MMRAVAHEAGHRWAAARRDVQLGPPIFVPAWLGFLGSFGAITFIRRVLPDRCAALLLGHWPGPQQHMHMVYLLDLQTVGSIVMDTSTVTGSWQCHTGKPGDL